MELFNTIHENRETRKARFVYFVLFVERFVDLQLHPSMSDSFFVIMSVTMNNEIS